MTIQSWCSWLQFRQNHDFSQAMGNYAQYISSKPQDVALAFFRDLALQPHLVGQEDISAIAELARSVTLSDNASEIVTRVVFEYLTLSSMPEQQRAHIHDLLLTLLEGISDRREVLKILTAIAQVPANDRIPLLQIAASAVRNIASPTDKSGILGMIFSIKPSDQHAALELILPLSEDQRMLMLGHISKLLSGVENASQRQEILRIIGLVPPNQRADLLGSFAEIQRRLFRMTAPTGNQTIAILNALRLAPQETRAETVQSVISFLVTHTSGFNIAVFTTLLQLPQEEREEVMRLAVPFLGLRNANILLTILRITREDRESVLRAAFANPEGMRVTEGILYGDDLLPPVTDSYRMPTWVPQVATPDFPDALAKTSEEIADALNSPGSDTPENILQCLLRCPQFYQLWVRAGYPTVVDGSSPLLQDACHNPETNTIFIPPKDRTKQQIAYRIIFETMNALQRNCRMEIDRRAAVGGVGREQYTRLIERMEYNTAIWTDQFNTRFRIPILYNYSGFSQCWVSANQPTVITRDGAFSHADDYRRQWDQRYRATRIVYLETMARLREATQLPSIL